MTDKQNFINKNHHIYLFFIASLFSLFLIISNISSNKLASVFGYTIDAGFIFFPITYIFNDILTEVFGFKTSRWVIWNGLLLNCIFIFCLWLVIKLPPSEHWNEQNAFAAVFNLSPRIFVASLFSYLLGEFINSAVLAKLKIITHGKYMGLRFIVSTIFGISVENILFYIIAFLFVFPIEIVFEMMVIQFIGKIGCEVIMLPITCRIANFLKKKSHCDYYDHHTVFNPFSLK